MAIQTACKRAYLTGEGEMRQSWGISTVIMNKRANACPKCLPFVGKILIDDVWSGGKASDGPYPLMSSAMAAGLYHPNCKDTHTTYFPELDEEPDSKFSKKELEQVKEDYRQDQKQQYAGRMVEQFDRLSKYSLDPEDKKVYAARKEQWENVVANGQKNDIIKVDNEVYESVNYRATLKLQEKKIYKDIAETAVVLDTKGNIVFSTSSGANNYVKFTEEQLAKMQGNVLTHNHPSGSTFSYEDVRLMTGKDLRAIRATSENITYQLEKSGNNQNKEDFIRQYSATIAENKKITDKLYYDLKNKYNKGELLKSEFASEIELVNEKYNKLNSEWLKDNAKKYGYRYSIIKGGS